MNALALRRQGRRLLTVFVLSMFLFTGGLALLPAPKASALDMEYPIDAVKSFQFYYSVVESCGARSYRDERVRQNKLDVRQNTTQTGLLIEADDGKLDCDEVMPLAVSFWGYPSAADALSDWGYTLQGDEWTLGLGAANSGGVRAALSAALNRKFYGNKAPGLTAEQLYVLYSQSFLIDCDLGGSWEYDDPNTPAAIKSAADAGGSNYLKATMAIGSPAAPVEMIYAVNDPSKGIAIVAEDHGSSLDDGSDNDGKLECRSLATRITKYAPGYVNWAKTHEEYNQQLQNLQDADNTGANSAEDDSTCGYDNNAMNWLGCPVTELLQTFTQKMGETLEGLLYFPAHDIFGDTEPDGTTQNLREVWTYFRNVALALIVIAGLIMVASEALGLGILDAYTIRKLMPRLGIALVGIALSWPLVQVAITLSNDAGTLVHSILTTPFRDMPIANAGPTNSAVNYGAVMLGVFVGIPALFYLGFMGVLSLLLTISVALLLGFVVLGMRWVVILGCLLGAPLAIAAYVLPGTQKLWSFWKTTLITTLLMFPIIMGMLSLGEVMARVTSQMENIPGGYFLVIIVYFGPYFFLVTVAKMAGGLMGTLTNLAGNASGGFFDRQKKYRHGTKERRKAKIAEKSIGGHDGIFQKTVGTAARMGAVNDINYLSRSGRARFRAAGEHLINESAQKRANEAAENVSGDTDGNLIGLQANSRSDYIRRYMAHKRLNGSTATDQALQKEAADKIAKLEGGYMADVGSQSFRRSALFSHVVKDNAAWDDIAGKKLVGETDGQFFERQQAAKEAVLRQLGSDGIIHHDDYAAMERANKSRPDNLYGSFGQHDDYVQKVLSGKVNAASRRGANHNMYEEVAASGATTSNKRAVVRLANQMSERLKASASGNNTALGTYTTEGGDTKNNLMGTGGMDTWAAEYAAGADIHEAQSYSGQGNAEKYAEVWQQEAFTEADLSSMPADIRTEAKKLIDGAKRAGKKVTHQDVKNHLQGNQVSFTDSAGGEVFVQPASSDAVKTFTARKKEWTAAYQQGKEKPGP